MNSTEKNKFPLASVFFTLYLILHTWFVRYGFTQGNIFSRLMMYLSTAVLLGLCVVLYMRKANLVLSCFYGAHVLLYLVGLAPAMYHWFHALSYFYWDILLEIPAMAGMILLAVFTFCLGTEKTSNFRKTVRKLWFLPGIFFSICSVLSFFFLIFNHARFDYLVFTTLQNLMYAVSMFLLGSWISNPSGKPEPVTYGAYNASWQSNPQPAYTAPAAPKFCTGCGQRLEGSPAFCPFCGKKIQAPAETPYTAPDQTYTNPAYFRKPDAPSGGMAVLGFFVPLVGLILYLVWKDETPLKAKSAGKGALIGFIVGIVLGFLSILLSILIPLFVLGNGIF